MTTWISKGAFAALALTLLTACEPGQGPAGLLSGTKASTATITQTKMAFGAVTLVAPPGFCIDPASLQQRFALMARCDLLGTEAPAQGAPIGIITVSLSAVPAEMVPSAEQSAAAFNLTNVSSASTVGSAIVFRADSETPAKGFSARHWRTTGRVGKYVMGAALFSPKDNPVDSTTGRGILSRLIAASQAES